MADKKFTNGLFIYKSKIPGLLNWSANKADYIKCLQEAEADENGFISGSYHTMREKPDRMYGTFRDQEKKISSKEHAPDRDLPF
tara:strand:+ start:278 stop:529 length:252 start_codon:yes stop_codon:yes gene_type:complete